MTSLSEENNIKLEKLDNAFLFIVGFVGLLFTIIQFYIEGINGLIEISPLLVLGIGLPFYVGYIRGSIEYGSSLTERVRGWAYLIVGVSIYVGVLLLPYGIAYYWVSLIFAVGFVYLTEKWFNRVFGMKNNINNLYAFSGTAVGGFLLAFLLGYIVRVYFVLSVLVQFSTALISIIFLGTFFFLTFLILEKLSRELMNANLPLKIEEIENRQKQHFFIRHTKCFGELMNLAFRQDRRIIYFLVGVLTFSIAAIFILLGSFYFGSLPIIPDTLIIMAIACFMIAAILFLKLKEINFSRFKIKP